MKYTEDNMNEKTLFVIEEKPDVIEGQGEGEQKPEGEQQPVEAQQPAEQPAEGAQ